jgi:hypothetical protein
MTERTWLAVAVLAVLFAIVAVSMLRSMRAKERASSASVPPPPQIPDGTVLGAARTDELEATYVSTVTAQDWLNRVPGHTLGRRSAARVRVHDAGVTLVRTGERDLFLPGADLVDAHRSPGQIGKYPGREGLVVLRWTLRDDDADLVLDTGLRLRHRADADLLVATVEGLVAEREGAAAPPADHPADTAEDPIPDGATHDGATHDGAIHDGPSPDGPSHDDPAPTPSSEEPR